jgi:heme/copper-type cytochrome/quinol oxidase subunit 3
MADAETLGPSLPVGALGRNSVGWLGMLCLIATEASLFAYLLFSYAYFAVRFGPDWLPLRHPSLTLAGPDTVILLSSSVAVWWGEKGAAEGRRGRLLAGLGLGIALGLVFLIVQIIEWKTKTFSLSSGAYGSFYFTITGFHMAHVIVGVIILAVVFAWSAAGDFTPRRHEPVVISSAYWHFVDIVWLVVFASFYIAPYLMAAP